MTTFTVTRVRKELHRDGSHEHIVAVCTNDGAQYNCRQVVESINSGNTWISSGDGYEVNIEPLRFCPKPNCNAQPYLRTHPTSIAKDNIENLDRF